MTREICGYVSGRLGSRIARHTTPDHMMPEHDEYGPNKAARLIGYVRVLARGALSETLDYQVNNVFCIDAVYTRAKFTGQGVAIALVTRLLTLVSERSASLDISHVCTRSHTGGTGSLMTEVFGAVPLAEDQCTKRLDALIDLYTGATNTACDTILAVSTAEFRDRLDEAVVRFNQGLDLG